MIQKQLDKIDKADIDDLISNEVREGRTIDYKQEVVGGKDADRKEFLADVCSFANTAGGDMLFGVTERRDANKTTGIPESASGIAGLNGDQEIRRLENMIRDGIKPRIPVQCRVVDGFSDGPLLVVRIPKSFSSPHMVTFQDSSRFYARNSAGKYQLDVGEIRSAFAQSEGLTERIRQFRADRVGRIISEDTPIQLQLNCIRVAMHVVPVASFDPTNRIDVTSMAERSTCIIRPLYSRTLPYRERYNLDGYLTYVSGTDEPRGYCYAQLFRNGVIETVEGGICERVTTTAKHLAFQAYEEQLLLALDAYLKVLQVMRLQTPIIVFATLIGVRGYELAVGQYPSRSRHHAIDRDVLMLPDVQVDNFSDKAETVLRPIFDAVWQSGGWPKSPSYSPDGKWQSS